MLQGNSQTIGTAQETLRAIDYNFEEPAVGYDSGNWIVRKILAHRVLSVDLRNRPYLHHWLRSAKIENTRSG